MKFLDSVGQFSLGLGLIVLLLATIRVGLNFSAADLAIAGMTSVALAFLAAILSVIVGGGPRGGGYV